MAEETKNKKTQTADLPNLIDVCDDSTGNPSFLIYDGGDLKVVRELKSGAATYIPPPKNAMPWVLPRSQEVLRHYREDADAKLFEDIMTCLRKNTELPDINLYSFLTAWILHTHIIEKFVYSPIIMFYAVAARGKTRTGSLLTWMARRGLHVETIREPDMFRKADRFCSTMFIDVTDIWKKAERLNAEDILLSRYRRDVIIARVISPEKDGFEDTRHYRCFGPTIIASNESPSYLLESRGVNIRMLESVQQFDNDIDEHDFLQLRERCTAFRARWINRELEKIQKPAKHRLGDILRPIAQIMTTIAPDKLHELGALINVFQEDHINVLADTPEGKIIKALLSLENDILHGIILTHKVVDKINENVQERFHMSPVTVGRRISSLGFKAGMIGSERGFYYDQELLDRLANQYGCLKKVSSPTQPTADMANTADEIDEVDSLIDSYMKDR